ncbi:MAG: D-aminoacylase [Anaerolineales bacterium]|nr:D-aminoacylase [Anaerolineales bacterium]
MIDILIQNAEIIDGTNKPRYQGDIVIEGGKISDILRSDDRKEGSPVRSAAKVIDASGRVVVPGFIDMHSHADLTLMVAPESESLVRQGITTVVGGQCGLSPAPLSKKSKKEAMRTINVVGAPQGSFPSDGVASFGAYLDYAASKKPAVNLVPLVAQGMVRAAVMGYQATRPNSDQIEEMRGLVEDSMQQGAFGISTGLIYPPGSFSSTEELIEVVKPAAAYGGIYFSHIRNEAGELLESLQEAIRIGRETGLPVQISHLKAAGKANWEKAAAALDLIEAARAEGLDVSADMYPYTAGSTHLAALLPAWAVEGGMTSVFKRLLFPWERKKIIAAMKAGEGEVVEAIEWDKVLICRSSNPAHTLRYISDLAAAEGKDPYIWTLDALVKTLGNIGMVIILMAEENVALKMQHPAVMFGTDGFGMATEGPMSTGMLHPRCFGTYPRIFGKYVREEGLLSLEEASWKASGFPAQKLGLKDRGTIQKGLQADLVNFDPATIRDRATYENPLQYPLGIDTVVVNGQIAFHEGQQSSRRFGIVVRLMG